MVLPMQELFRDGACERKGYDPRLHRETVHVVERCAFEKKTNVVTYPVLELELVRIELQLLPLHQLTSSAPKLLTPSIHSNISPAMPALEPDPVRSKSQRSKSENHSGL